MCIFGPLISRTIIIYVLQAVKRAELFGIPGVTYSFTQVCGWLSLIVNP